MSQLNLLGGKKMKNKMIISAVSLMLSIFCTAEATIKITSFKNESPIAFNEKTDEGKPYLDLISKGSGFVIDKEGAVISSTDGKYQIIFEDAGRSGFHRPHWKFHVWVKSEEGFPFMAGGKVLHSVFFYDGEGEMNVRLCKGGKLFIIGGRDVLYPWKVGTIGRGNPYHKINHDAQDQNGIAYFDYDGFVGYPYNYFTD
jgi:hypothetical protein